MGGWGGEKNFLYGDFGYTMGFFKKERGHE